MDTKNVSKSEYPEEFLNDLWNSISPKEKESILDMASFDLKKEWREWHEEFMAHEREMEDSLGITEEMKEKHRNWGREDDHVDLNEENN